MATEKIMCRRCVLHSRVPGVTINEEGYCLACYNSNSKPPDNRASNESINLEKKMVELFKNVKKQKRPYDAMVLFSGGKDSTYLVHWAKEKYNLRIVSFTMVYPISKEISLKNIDAVSKKLNMDVIKFQPDEDIYKKYMRYALLEGHKYGYGESIGCFACSFLFRWVSVKLAMGMDIPIILDGMDKSQAGYSIFLEGEKIKRDLKKGKKLYGPCHDMFSKALGEEYNDTVYGYNQKNLKSRKFPAIIAPYTFINYDYVNSFDLIEKMGLDSNNFKTLLTNCDAAYLFDYLAYKKYDCPTYIQMYANGIRNEMPTIEQLNDNTKRPELLKRENMIHMLEEYRRVLDYVAENKLTPKNINAERMDNLRKVASANYMAYGAETAEYIIGRILRINEFADYFDINLSSVQEVDYNKKQATK